MDPARRAPLRGVLVIGLAGALLLAFGAWRWQRARLPGTSYDGPPPAALPAERALAL